MVCLVRKTVAACLFICVLGLLAGFIQGGAFQASIANYQDYVGEKISVEGLVREDPYYSKKGFKQFVLSDARVVDGGREDPLRGEIFISTPTSPDALRHDRVKVTGKLKSGFGPFQGSINYATVETIAHEQNIFDTLRSRFASGVISVLPEPHASLGLGFVIGMKSALPAHMSEALQDLSLTHIVVASGYNLTVLVRMAKRLREKKSRLQTLLLSFGLIATFLMITGNSPSMVRAGLVCGLSLLAWYFGRNFKPLLILLLVMAVTAYAYPPYLWGDIGWWLSFAAFAGILLVVPLITSRFWPDRSPPLLAQAGIESTVAQLMTLPIILLFFQNLSIVGLLANIVIVPLIPFAMLAVATAGFADMIVPVIAGFIAIPAHAIMALIVWLVQAMNTPWAAISASISMTALIVWYTCVATGIIAAWKRLSALNRERALAKQIV